MELEQPSSKPKSRRGPSFHYTHGCFEEMGKNVTPVGRNGVGQMAKVANQLIVALTIIEDIGEALLLASKGGADPAKVRQELMGSFASSKNRR